MNYLLQLDTNLFFLINHLPHNFFLDNFFGAISFIGEAGAVWFFLSFLLFLKSLKNQPRKATPYEARKLAVIWGMGMMALLLTFFLKEIFRRVRPEFILPNVILPFGPDSSFSFPSGHALVSFAFTYLLANSTRRLLRRLRLLAMTGFYTLAVLISFSRIYLGYHYPLDIIGGAIIGVGIAYFVKILNTKY